MLAAKCTSAGVEKLVTDAMGCERRGILQGGTTYRMKDVVKSSAGRKREILIKRVDTPYSQKKSQGAAYSKHVVNRESQLDCIYLGLPRTTTRTSLREGRS